MTAVTSWIALVALGTPATEQELIDTLVELTNETRAKHEAKSLQWDETAAKIARSHSQDMVARQFFDHVTPDGSTLADRAHSGGLSVFEAVGENLGKGSRDPRVMMSLWMESGGHRRNILNRRFTHIGIGYTPGSRTRDSAWCVVFVAR